jgi:hypothetical protein
MTPVDAAAGQAWGQADDGWGAYDQYVLVLMLLQAKPGVKLMMIGETIDGHDLNLLQLGTPGPGKPNVWIIARQHPGV